MYKKYASVMMAGVFVLLGILMFVSSFGMKSLAHAQVGPEFVPRIIAVCMVALGVVHVISELRVVRAGTGSAVPAEQGSTQEQEREDGKKTFLKQHGFLFTLVLIFAYAALMKPVGFILTTVGYMLCQICILAHDLRPVKLAQYALLSTVVSVGIYLLFVYVFGMILPAGILG